MQKQKKCKIYARLIHKTAIEDTKKIRISKLFRLRFGGERIERGISLINTECATNKNGGVCGYVRARQDTYRSLGTPCIFWLFDAGLLSSTYKIEQDKNCHAELIIKPEHNQISTIADKNNEDLLKFVKEIFREEDVYVCVDNKHIPFSQSSFLKNKNSHLVSRETTKEEEKEIASFKNLIK